LFWLFLWQLKEYRFERFVDHFRTAKGRRLLFNPLLGVKLVLLGAALFVPNAVFFALLLYAVELLRKSPRPVFTKKIQVLAILLIVFAFAFGFSQTLVFLLLFDITTPLVVSGLVLGLQPFTVLVRNRRLAQAKAKRAMFPNVKVVGITGSYGKTSTKEFLAHILSAKFRVLKTPEHQNSEFGVANTILQKLTAEHQVFVCEMGAYKKGEIKALAQAAQPHIGIVTGVNEQHLATFGSMENLLSAEGGEELIGSLPKGGAAILNGASQKLKAQISKLKTAARNVKFIVAGEDVRAEDVRVEKEHISFTVYGVKFRVPAYGGHNAQNLLGAIGAARELGMDLQEIAKAAASMPLELSPLKVKKAASGITVIDSTYSANPDGVIADLDYLGLYEGKKALVMPSLIELGPAAKEAHKKIGRKIAQVCDVAIITTREHFADIKEGAGGSEKVVYMENAQEILEKVKGADAILLESRLPETLIKKLQGETMV